MARNRKKQRIVPIHRPSAPDPASSVRDVPSPLLRRLLPTIGILLIVISGVIHGIQTNRWTRSTEVLEAAARFNDVPKTIGDWESTDLTIPDDQLKQAGAAGYLARVYKNRTTRREVHVMMLCGEHGPISLHPPTVCFTSAGWVVENQKRSEITKSDSDMVLGEFQDAVFRRQSPTQIMRMKTLWAWNSDGKWLAPDDPRFAFAGSPYLYKLYISTVLPQNEQPRQEKKKSAVDDPATDFAREFLPLLKTIRI